MGDILPECLEIQFGWIKISRPKVHNANLYHTVNFPDGSNEFRIRMVCSGSFIFSCNDQQWPMGSASVILLPPFAPGSSFSTRVLETGVLICVGFRLLLFGNIDITQQLLPNPSVWHPDQEEYDALNALMRLLEARSSSPTMSASFIRDGLLRAIIGLGWVPLGMTRITEGQHPQVPKWLGFVLQELRHNPGMTVTELERLTGYSHTHLDRLFVQHVGASPRNYLQRYRFDLAKHLLHTTEMTVSAISEHLGFSNTTDFTRFFRRMGQKTPTEYRQTTDASPERALP